MNPLLLLLLLLSAMRNRPTKHCLLSDAHYHLLISVIRHQMFKYHHRQHLHCNIQRMHLHYGLPMMSAQRRRHLASLNSCPSLIRRAI
ncbi:hypothetical protein BDF22DRAFT_689092 [Syncephalis plumigaleata]|nr:hypothetical protein BDF22DRAFT_689092 [Syncephalis plumigaleata]